MITFKFEKNLSDEKLFQLCKKYGTQTKLWRQKFIGLLPEVYRRKLFEKKGFHSIFEFAAKLAGLSHDQVCLVLNLERRFEDKPILKNLLVEGEVSITKLARVVSIATPENQEFLATKIQLLPNRALETLVRDEKVALAQIREQKNENGSPKPLFEDESLHVQTLNFEISPDVAEELNELHAKGIDVNELLREMLQKRRTEIAEKKAEIAQEISETLRHLETVAPTTSRYIPTRIKKIIRQEFGEKCSILTCRKPSTQIHHTQRFALAHSHDPRFLAPLCAEHHLIAHSVDLKFHGARTSYVNSS